jgi:hypothetical protein
MMTADEWTLPVIEDEINKPSHYHKGGIDVIGFAELHYSKEELKGFLSYQHHQICGSLRYKRRIEKPGESRILPKKTNGAGNQWLKKNLSMMNNIANTRSITWSY